MKIIAPISTGHGVTCNSPFFLPFFVFLNISIHKRNTQGLKCEKQFFLSLNDYVAKE